MRARQRSVWTRYPRGGRRRGSQRTRESSEPGKRWKRHTVCYSSSARPSQIKGETEEERVKAWYKTTQNGFREKRITAGQVISLRRIIEGVKNKNLPAVMTFIDFKNARGNSGSVLRLHMGQSGVSWPSGLAYRTQVLVLAAECGFESRP